MITDCHVHIQPMEMVKPAALEMMKARRPNYDLIAEYCRSPKLFLKHLDDSGVDRAVLINYVAPEVMGFTPAVNQFIADYCKENPKRLAFLRQSASQAHDQCDGGCRATSQTRHSHD